MHFPLGYILVALLMLALAAWWTFSKFFDNYPFAVVQAGVLYRDGFRTLRELDGTIARARIKTVVSLLDDDEIKSPPFCDESTFCQSRGVRMVRIPIRLGGWPTSEGIHQFLAVVSDPSAQPVLVHCAQGVRRTGMMVAAYRRSVQGLSAQQTADGMLTFGHSRRTIGDIQRFIDVYDAAAKCMIADLPVSDE
jgi:protein tyrosine/serine phosphatase